MSDVLKKFEQINTLVFDMDGVLTDGSLLIMPGGSFLRTMDIKDGYALQLAIKKGFRVLVISGSTSDACIERLNYLGIVEVFMKVPDKLAMLQNYLQVYQLSPDQVLYMGDDIPDLAAMQYAGLACAPCDAVSDVLAAADYITLAPGGKGAAREVIEKLMRLKDCWDTDAAAIASK